MKYYAVFDTNVLVSSLLTKNKDSATCMVLDAVSDGEIVPLYSAEIMDEYEEVLRRPKFPFSFETVDGILQMIRTLGFNVVPKATNITLTDMDDLIFYEVVMEKKKEGDAYLITGNIRHFPTADFIVTPAEMMEIIRKK